MIGKSRDLLFQFQLLVHRQRGGRRVAVFRRENRWMYLVLDEKGFLLHPMTGLPIEPAADWIPAGTVKMGTLDKHVKSFWDFRDLGKGLRSGRVRYSLYIDGLHLCDEGKVDKAALAEVSGRWPGWALGRGKDAICDCFKGLRLRDISSRETTPFEPGVALCPIDGPVRFIVGEYSSPAREWADLCGRRFEFALCPECLGTFESHLTCMN
jgi:hypothetical protein